MFIIAMVLNVISLVIGIVLVFSSLDDLRGGSTFEVFMVFYLIGLSVLNGLNIGWVTKHNGGDEMRPSSSPIMFILNGLLVVCPVSILVFLDHGVLISFPLVGLLIFGAYGGGMMSVIYSVIKILSNTDLDGKNL